MMIIIIQGADQYNVNANSIPTETVIAIASCGLMKRVACL